MSFTRLRLGEIVTAIGALGLAVTLWFGWYGLERDAGVSAPGAAKNLTDSGWTGLDIAGTILVVIALLAALLVIVTAAGRQAPAWAVGATIITTLSGIIAFCAVAISMIAQPGLGIDLPNQLVNVRGVAYAGLVLAALIPTGGWMALADERTDAPYSAAPHIEPRPAPPAGAPASSPPTQPT
jgi:hypothetical protein